VKMSRYQAVTKNAHLKQLLFKPATSKWHAHLLIKASNKRSEYQSRLSLNTLANDVCDGKEVKQLRSGFEC